MAFQLLSNGLKSRCCDGQAPRPRPLRDAAPAPSPPPPPSSPLRPQSAFPSLRLDTPGLEAPSVRQTMLDADMAALQRRAQSPGEAACLRALQAAVRYGGGVGGGSGEACGCCGGGAAGAGGLLRLVGGHTALVQESPKPKPKAVLAHRARLHSAKQAHEPLHWQPRAASPAQHAQRAPGGAWRCCA